MVPRYSYPLVPGSDSLDQAIVLRKIGYGEADAIVSLFTREHGKLSVYARAQKTASRKADRFIFAIGDEISLSLKRRVGSDLFAAHAITMSYSRCKFFGCLTQMASLSAVLEAYVHLIKEGEKDETLYELLTQTLRHLDLIKPPDDPVLHLDFFNQRDAELLTLLGYSQSSHSVRPLDVFDQHTAHFEALARHRFTSRQFLREFLVTS